MLDKKSFPLVLKLSPRGVFVAGILTGAVLTIAIGTLWSWWKPHPLSWADISDPVAVIQRTDAEQEVYDACLANGNGTVACDAMMRMIGRERAKKAAPPFDPSKPFTPVK